MVEIFDQNGEVKQYIPVSERLSAFLEEYGPAQGYRVETQVKDYLGFHEGLAKVYRAAVQSGQGNAKLPAVDPAVFVFEAKLVDNRNRTVAQASALRRVDTSLDIAIQGRVWEAGETAALQRLMARLGHGSDNLLADEMGDMANRGLNFQGEGQPQPDSEQPVSNPDNGSDGKDDDQSSPEAKRSGAELTKPKKSARPAQADGDVPAAILRQLKMLAVQRGVEPPEVATKADAKEALKKLREMPAQG